MKPKVERGWMVKYEDVEFWLLKTEPKGWTWAPNDPNTDTPKGIGIDGSFEDFTPRIVASYEITEDQFGLDAHYIANSFYFPRRANWFPHEKPHAKCVCDSLELLWFSGCPSIRGQTCWSLPCSQPQNESQRHK